MGKTAVFVLGVLHSLKVPGAPFQCLVICHTRELAIQITKEFERMGKYLTGLKLATLYGGVNPEAQSLQIESNPPHVVIGTPGRTLDFVKKGIIKLENLTHFVIDECDNVLEKMDMRGDVQEIFLKTKPKKQVMMFTATLNEKMKEVALKFMKDVHHVIYIDDQKKLVLHGLRQFYTEITEKQKNKMLFSLLHKVTYNQAIIFTSKVDRAKFLNKMLLDMEFPSITIHSEMSQKVRLFNKN
jgi:ATP-dependent RNA helicase UAP56/SUB2